MQWLFHRVLIRKTLVRHPCRANNFFLVWYKFSSQVLPGLFIPLDLPVAETPVLVRSHFPIPRKIINQDYLLMQQTGFSSCYHQYLHLYCVDTFHVFIPKIFLDLSIIFTLVLYHFPSLLTIFLDQRGPTPVTKSGQLSIKIGW